MAHDKDTTDKFPAGLIVKHPHENAPDFVRAKLHIVKKEFMSMTGNLQSLKEYRRQRMV